MRTLRKFSLLLSRFVDEKPIDKLRRLSKNPPESWGLPWNFEGVPGKEFELRYLADRLLIENKVSAVKLLSTLYDKYETILQAFASNQLYSVNDLLEPRLKSKLQSLLDDLYKQNRRVEAVKDEIKFGKEKRPTVNFSDGLIIRGLSIDRDQNDFISNYHVFSDSLMGITCFTHLDISNPLAYTDQARLEDLYKRNRLSVLRLLLWIQSPWKLNVTEEDRVISHYPQDYSWAQEWVFECKLEQPEWMKDENRSESYLEWMAKFKLGTWRVSEMSEVLDGNPLVT